MAIREQTGREISSPFENKIVAAGGIPAAKDSRAMIRAYRICVCGAFSQQTGRIDCLDYKCYL